MLIVGRAVAGMGSSGLLNGGYTIVYASVAPARQTGESPDLLGEEPLLIKMIALLGVVMGVAAIGLLCGPVIGGLLTEYASWRWCTDTCMIQYSCYCDRLIRAC